MRTSCEVDWLSPSILEFRYRGKVTVEDLQAMADNAHELIRERVPKAQLVDTLAVESVPKELGEILNELLNSYREAGGSLVVMIATSQLNAMLGRSMSFGAGIELELFDNRSDALKFVSNLSRI